MKKNTVLLDLEEYNELKNLNEEIENFYSKEKFAVIESRWESNGDYYQTRKYYIESEIIADFERRIKLLEAEVNMTKKGAEALIRNAKKMSCWEFLKWRKS